MTGSSGCATGSLARRAGGPERAAVQILRVGQFRDQVELTAAYVHGDRTFEDGAAPDNVHSADFLRLQVQLNY